MSPRSQNMSGYPYRQAMYFLIISNDVHCRTFFVRNLIARGQLAVGAGSVVEAQNLVNVAPPSCIILCQHPRLTDRIVSQIRENEQLAELPIIAVSEERPLRSWMEHWNIHRFIQSPLSIATMLDALSPWLSVITSDHSVSHE